LASNRIEHLEHVAHLTLLEELWMNHNQLDSWHELECLRTLPLQTLYLEGNPLQKDVHYKTHICRMFPALTQLDAEPLNLQYRITMVEERVKPVLLQYPTYYPPVSDDGVPQLTDAESSPTSSSSNAAQSSLSQGSGFDSVLNSAATEHSDRVDSAVSSSSFSEDRMSSTSENSAPGGNGGINHVNSEEQQSAASVHAGAAFGSSESGTVYSTTAHGVFGAGLFSTVLKPRDSKMVSSTFRSSTSSGR
jgi:hypothetical protein